MAKIALFLIIGCLQMNLFSEIEKVSFNWTAGLCPQNCVIGLEQQLRQYPEIDSIVINQAGGQLTWKPNQIFSFIPLNQASRMVGIRILTTRVKVKGRIVESGGTFYIVSTGDNSRIQLIGPIQPSPDRYVIQQSIDSHPLSDAMKARLIEFEQKNKEVVVDGPLFEPARMMFLALIVENLTSAKEQQEDASPKKR